MKNFLSRQQMIHTSAMSLFNPPPPQMIC